VNFGGQIMFKRCKNFSIFLAALQGHFQNYVAVVSYQSTKLIIHV
jgi:hypothetical protein